MNRILLKRLALGFAIASPLAFAISCSSPEKTVTEPEQTPENPGGNNPGGNTPDPDTQNPGYMPTTPTIEYKALKRYVDSIVFTQKAGHSMTITKWDEQVSATFDIAYFQWWNLNSTYSPITSNVIQMNITGHAQGTYLNNPYIYYMIEKTNTVASGQKQSYLMHIKGETRDEDSTVSYYRDPITVFSSNAA